MQNYEIFFYNDENMENDSVTIKDFDILSATLKAIGSYNLAAASITKVALIIEK